MSFIRSPIRPTVLVEFDDAAFTHLEASPAPNYTYEALPSKGDHFRLVQLLPGAFHDRIEIKIEIADFDRFDTPPYLALSYTWNDSNHDRLIVAGNRILMSDPIRLQYDIRHPVWVGDQRLLISTNLRDALRRLRHGNRCQPIWIDAICINQNDLDERASQVVIMQRIYHKAAIVKLWLGEGSHASEEALHLLRQLAELRLKPTAPRSVKDLYSNVYLKSVRLPPFPSPVWHEVLDLLDRPVFSRIWIVQELVAAVTALVHCGPYEPLPFDVLASAVYMLAKTGWLHEARRTFMPEEAYFLSITAISDIRKMWRQEQTVELRHKRRRELVCLTRAFLASDPSDKVFALIPLINDYGHRSLFGEDCPDGVVPDSRLKSRILPGIQRIIDERQDLIAARVLQNTTDPALVGVGTALVAFLELALEMLPIFQSPIPEADFQQHHQAMQGTWSQSSARISHFKRYDRKLDEDNHVVQQYLDRLYPKLISRVNTFYDLLLDIDAKTLLSFADDAEYHKDVQELKDLVTMTHRSLTDPAALPRDLSSGVGVVGPLVTSEDISNGEWDSDSSVGGTTRRRITEIGVPISAIDSTSGHNDADPEQSVSRMTYRVARKDDEREERDWAWTPRGLRVPDYRLAIENTYTEFTIKCIQDDRNLDMLLGIEDRSERVHTTLPSWVPDLSISPSCASLRRWTGLSGNSKYHASGIESTHIQWNKDSPRLLALEGYKFDVIESLASEKTIWGSFQTNRPLWEALVAHLPSRYPFACSDPNDQTKSVVSLREAFWRTMIGDGVYAPGDFITPAPDEYGRYYEVLDVVAGCDADIHDLNERMRSRFESGLVTSDDLNNLVEIEARMMLLIDGVAVPRRFSVTMKGFLGLMPPAAQEGDLIYLLKGGATPFVLRPLSGDDSKLEMIGACFVYGVMNGEALQQDGFRWEEVTIA